MTVSLDTLDIRGYRDQPVPNTFRKQAGATHLAVLLPGRNYSCQAPLLYYPSLLFTEGGGDVLQVEYTYFRADFDALSEEEQLRRLFTDAGAAWRAALEQRRYQRVTLVGKSLGTLAMPQLLTESGDLPPVRAIWLTPLLKVDGWRQHVERWGGDSLFIIGTADPHYDPALLDGLEHATNGEAVVVEGGDHGLTVEGDIWASLRALERVVHAVNNFTR